MKQHRRAFLLSVLGAAVGGLAYGAQRAFTPRADTPGAFVLQDVSGREVAGESYRGRWSLFFFGYTHCPDFCPTAMLTAGAALDALGRDAGEVRVTFITLDPDRDTPRVLAAYLESFDPRIAGLSGTAGQTTAAARAFKVFFRKRAQPDSDDYTIDHTAAFWLLDPRGRPAEVYGYDIAPHALAASIRGHMFAPAG